MNRIWKSLVSGALICFVLVCLIVAPVTAKGNNPALSADATVSLSTLMTDRVISQLSVLNLNSANPASTAGTARVTVV